MFLGYGIVAIALSAVLAGSAWAKLTRNDQVVTMMTGLGVPLKQLPFLAGCEIAGAVGLLAGLAYPPLGIAAAIGVILYFVGAVVTHLRAGDRNLVPPLALLVLAAVVLWLRIGSM